LTEINSIPSQNFDAPCNDMSTLLDLGPWINLFQQPGTFDTGFLKHIANMSAEYDGIREKWSNGLIAAGEGRLQDAQKALISLSSELAPDIRNKLVWIEAARAAVNHNVDTFLVMATRAAGEMEWI
jgi:hypothetical protein